MKGKGEKREEGDKLDGQGVCLKRQRGSARGRKNRAGKDTNLQVRKEKKKRKKKKKKRGEEVDNRTRWWGENVEV